MKRALISTFLAAVLLASSGAASAKSFETSVVFLQAIAPDRAAALHERVLGKLEGTAVVVDAKRRTVTVRDTPARLERFRALLALVDLPGRESLRVYVRPVLHRTPEELAELAEELLKARTKGRGHVPHFVPVAGSDQLIVQTTRQAYLGVVDPLLRRLDRAAGGER